MSITVDFANPYDILDLLALGQEYYKELSPPGVSFDKDKVMQSMHSAIDGKGNSVLLTSRDGENDITGYVYGSIGSHFYSKDRACTLNSMFVSPKHRGGLSAVKLMHAFKRWGTQNGVKVFYFNVASGIRMQETDTFLRKMGFQLTGGNYMLSV